MFFLFLSVRRGIMARAIIVPGPQIPPPELVRDLGILFGLLVDGFVVAVSPGSVDTVSILTTVSLTGSEPLLRTV